MKYRVIICDPPWAYAKRDKDTKFGSGTGNYSAGVLDTKTIGEMGKFLSPVCEEDSYLFMWATFPKLQEALDVMKAWGYHYKTVAFTWVKTNKDGTPFKGPGSFTFSNTEVVLLGRKKGTKCWHSNASGCWKPSQVVPAPHVRERGKIIHSRKPAIFHELIRKWLDPFIGEGQYLELFATQETLGWTCIGHALSENDLSVDLLNLASIEGPLSI